MSETVRFNNVNFETYAIPNTTTGLLDPTKKATGIIATAKVGEAVAIGQVLYADDTAGELLLADADAAGEKPAVAIALEAGTDGKYIRVLLLGYIYDESLSLTLNGACYLSATPGTMTQTAPGAGNDQVLGFALGATEWMFNPSHKMA